MLYLLTFTEVMKNDKSCVVFPPGIHITLRRIEITNALKTTGSFIIIFTNVFDRGTAFLLPLYYLPGTNFCKQNFTFPLSIFPTPLMTFCKRLYILQWDCKNDKFMIIADFMLLFLFHKIFTLSCSTLKDDNLGDDIWSSIIFRLK